MLQQLGINATVIIQFVIFIATFVALIKLVYEPFAQVHQERLKNTKGSVEIADDILKKTQELQLQYSNKAKEVHGKISEVFKKSKIDGNTESEKILNDAKTQAAGFLDENRKNLEVRSAQLEAELKDVKASLIVVINNKLLGKS